MAEGNITYGGGLGEARRSWPDARPAGGWRLRVAVGAILLGVIVLAGSTAAMFRGLDPFATSYYLFAWYATLLVLDGVVALNGGARDAQGVKRFLLLERPAFTATMLAWSAVVWLFYELLNFRLQNWYYVFVPDGHLTRWVTVLVSFATVLPAVFVSMAMLRGFGVAHDVRWRPLRVTPGLLRGLQVTGGLMLALAMLEPHYFFPLVWGGGTLMIEPVNYRRDPERSLIADLERGEPKRIIRLLVGGLMIGLLWEMFNFEARGKWIYTVPFFERLKLFEMPLLGFFGFPPFAVECFTVWQALVISGMAVPRWERVRPATRAARVGAVTAAVVFSALVLHVMENRTISSVTPRLAELPGVPAAALSHAGYDVFSLAGARPDAVGQRLGADPTVTAGWIETAQLATLRGIGVRNARLLQQAGVGCIASLAAADGTTLARRLEAMTNRRVVDARIRVWIRAAQRAVRRNTTNTALHGSSKCNAA
jgi:hypothetical protein